MRGGWLTIVRLRGVVFRAHWTFLIPFVVALDAPMTSLFWLAIVLGHELGHAFFVRLFGAEVLGIDVWILGGFCRWRGQTSFSQRSIVAWGGVLVQLAMLAVATLALYAQPKLFGDFTSEFSAIFIDFNAAMIALNLLPFPPLDGGEAWKIIPYSLEKVVDTVRGRKLRQTQVSVLAELATFERHGGEKSKFDIN